MTVSIYIKTHNKTGLKYFGMTTRNDVFKYPGSGVYWLKHINKHGRDVNTEVIATFEERSQELTDFCLKFSEENDIVNSEEWANLVYEDGIQGGTPGVPLSEEHKEKISKSTKKRVFSEETKQKMREARARRAPASEETKQKMRKAKLGKTRPEEVKRKISESMKKARAK